MRALTGRGCDCGRCAAERALPEEVQGQLADVHTRMGAEWAAALDAAAAEGDEGALAALWVSGAAGSARAACARPAGILSGARRVSRVLVHLA